MFGARVKSGPSPPCVCRLLVTLAEKPPPDTQGLRVRVRVRRRRAGLGGRGWAPAELSPGGRGRPGPGLPTALFLRLRPPAGSSFRDVMAEGVHEGRPTVSPLQAPVPQTSRVHGQSQGHAPRHGQEGPVPWKKTVGVSDNRFSSTSFHSPRPQRPPP